MALERQVHHSRHRSGDYDQISSDDANHDNDEEQFRACPRIMSDDSSRCGLLWRIVTVMLCLPLCYPCYLTKQARKHFRRKESPKKLTRGRCSHHHNISGSSSYLSNSCSSLATTVKTNNSSKVDTVQELGVMFIMSGTGNKMLESMEVVEGEERSYGVMGSVMTTVDETSYKVTLHQETLAGHQRQETLVSSLNMVVMVYRDMSELQDMVNNETGLLGHLRHYWRGFMPLLLVQVGCPGDMIKQTVTETLGSDFSSCFRLHISDPCSESNAIIENCVRFHLHNVKFQCSKLERSASANKSLVSQQWKCSGLCGLESYKPDPLRKKKRSVINAIRRKISRMES